VATATLPLCWETYSVRSLKWLPSSALSAGAFLGLCSCGDSGTAGSSGPQPPPGWSAAQALETPGPSSIYGNWGKAITTDGAGHVDVVWLQGGSTNDDGTVALVGTGAIMFAESADGGATWSRTALTAVAPNTGLPKIASSDSDIYVVWSAQDLASSNLQIFSLHGTRSGAQVQWSTPTEISNAPPGANANFPAVAPDGDDLHVAWSDNRNAGITEVYYARSLDKGATWSTPMAISPVDGFNSWTPSIAAYSGDVYIAWTDARFGTSACNTNGAACHEVLYFRSSGDAGQTWGTETQLTCDPSIYTYAPSLFVEDTTLHIAYFQGNPAPTGSMSLYYLRGTNRGASLAACSGTQGTQPAIDPHYPSGDTVLSAWRPNISVHDGTVHMVWWGELTDDYETGQSKVYYSESSDGVSWAAVTSLTPQSDGATYRALAPNISLSADGSTVYAIWEDHRNDPDALDPDYELYFSSGTF